MVPLFLGQAALIQCHPLWKPTTTWCVPLGSSSALTVWPGLRFIPLLASLEWICDLCSSSSTKTAGTCLDGYWWIFRQSSSLAFELQNAPSVCLLGDHRSYPSLICSRCNLFCFSGDLWISSLVFLNRASSRSEIVRGYLIRMLQSGRGPLFWSFVDVRWSWKWMLCKL